MPEALRPVLDVSTPKPNTTTLSPHLRRFTQFIRISAALAGLCSLALSVYYFAGFAENDTGFSHLFHAFILCFGLGALIFIPAFYIARKAHHVLNRGPRMKLTLKILALMLPWVFTGIYLLRLEGLWKFTGLLLFALAIIFVWWSAHVWKFNKAHLS